MDKMETNFKLVIDNDIEITANTISWVSWNGHGLDQAHDGPGAGRSLFLDFNRKNGVLSCFLHENGKHQLYQQKG